MNLEWLLNIIVYVVSVIEINYSYTLNSRQKLNPFGSHRLHLKFSQMYTKIYNNTQLVIVLHILV